MWRICRKRSGKFFRNVQAGEAIFARTKADYEARRFLGRESIAELLGDTISEGHARAATCYLKVEREKKVTPKVLDLPNASAVQNFVRAASDNKASIKTKSGRSRR